MENERKELVHSFLGKTVNIKIDRPIGYVHQKDGYSLTYPVNYGYIPDVIGGDGEELDVYLLGISVPVAEYTAEVIGIVHRRNDVEDKLLAVPHGMDFTKEEIAQAVHFQEQYYDTEIELHSHACEIIRQYNKVYSDPPEKVRVSCRAFVVDNGRLLLSQQVMNELRRHYADKLLDPPISRSVKVSEAPGFGMPVYYHDKRNKGSVEYLACAKDLASRI